MTRDEISALLPFLANDTLSGEERNEVQAAVNDDADLAAELQALTAIRETMQAEDLGFSPGEMGLARLLRDVEREAPSEKRVNRPWVWQSIAAALLAAVVGQVVFTNQSSDPGGFQLAGGEAPIRVMFTEGTSEAAMRELLLDAGVQIVGGPSDLGFYDLAPLEGVSATSASDALKTAAIVESLEVSGE